MAKTVAQRVRNFAAQLGYVANIAARSLRGVRPSIIGLVVGDMLDPYYGEIAEAVTLDAEARHGTLAIVCNMQRDPLHELKSCRQLWEHRVAGLILSCGGFDQKIYRTELAQLVGAMQSADVVVAALGPRSLQVPVFSVDNRQAGVLAAKCLLDANYRHIGILTGHLQSETAHQRFDDAMAKLKSLRAKVAVLHADFRLDTRSRCCPFRPAARSKAMRVLRQTVTIRQGAPPSCSPESSRPAVRSIDVRKPVRAGLDALLSKNLLVSREALCSGRFWNIEVALQPIDSGERVQHFQSDRRARIFE